MTERTANLPASLDKIRSPLSTTVQTKKYFALADFGLEALETWKASYPMPATVTPERLLMARTALSGPLEPASPEGFAVALKTLTTFGRAFGIPTPQLDDAIAIYREDLAHLPADVLIAAIKEVRAGWTWGNRLPMPADILKAAHEEMNKRWAPMHHVQRAESHFRRETKAEAMARQVAERDKAADRARDRRADVSALAAGSVRRPPRAPDPTPADLERERQRQLAEARALMGGEAAE